MSGFINILLFLVLVFGGLVITAAFFGFRRGNTLVGLLKQGKYEEALERITQQMDQHQGDANKASTSTFLSMQKAEICFFLGRFAESLNILDQVQLSGANMPLRLWHTTLKLQNLLLSQGIEVAQEFYRNNTIFLSPEDKERIQVANTLDFANGLYNFFAGELEQSKILFENLIKRPIPKRYLAVSTYYLAEIDQRYGNIEAAAVKREQAKLIDEHVYVNKEGTL